MRGAVVVAQFDSKCLRVCFNAELSGCCNEVAIFNTRIIQRGIIIRCLQRRAANECGDARRDLGRGQSAQFPKRVDRDHVIERPGRRDVFAGLFKDR